MEELENLLIFKICHNRRDVGLRLLKYTLLKEVEVMQRRQEELSCHWRLVCLLPCHSRTRSSRIVDMVSAALA
jgi:hypothetical protein